MNLTQLYEQLYPYLTPANIAFAAYALVWLLSLIHCSGYRKLGNIARRQLRLKAKEPQPISVVVTTENQCHLLRERLPLFLEQDHPNFEIIVVDICSYDDTHDYLSAMAEEHPRLVVRTLPSGTKNISQEQLALTLGIRTACNDWVLLTDISCRPVSNRWLSVISSRCGKKRKMVLGYTRHADPHGWSGIRRCFFTAWQQMLNLTHARRLYAYRAQPTNLCYRKDFFMKHSGFASNTSLLTGATDIMVNTHSTRENAGICLLPDTVMLQDCPTNNSASWSTERLFFMETRRHLPHHITYRMRYFHRVFMVWLHTLALFAALALTLLFTPPPYYLSIAVGVMWFVHMLWRNHCINSTMLALGEPRLYLSTPLLLHLIAKWDATAWLHHRFTNKKRFRKRFI